ncbi:MAG TPA: hypothetical protein VNM92_04775 [Thermoanaerobaculia bacterium]|nr:hypothetical protein [Thermoanaerobaculia bacterium]
MLILIPLTAVADTAVVRKVPNSRNLLSISAERASVRELIASISHHIPESVVLEFPSDRTVSYRSAAVEPRAALRAVTKKAGLELRWGRRGWVVADPKEPTVTIDVKDEPVVSILKNVQKQCAIRNLMIDPDVQGTGTFLFREVPCSIALRTIFRSLGLQGEVHPGSLVRVGSR